MPSEPSLASLVEAHFLTLDPSERVSHAGAQAAQAWNLGAEGMRSAGFLLPPALHRALAAEAQGVLEGELQGAEFLSRLRRGLGFDDFFTAFLQALDRWELGQGEEAPREAPGLKPGDELGGYVVLDLIGEGGMGSVYRARQTSLDRLVALKVLHPHHAQDPLNVERFRDEARAVAKLRHPNVVQILEARSEGEAGPHYIVLELVEGASLDRRMEGDPIGESEALRITLDVAKALQCAERGGYVHRDVKPANILLTPEGSAKLSDLGLAQKIEEGQTRKTTAGLIMGTPHYMAPEQALDEDQVDIRADLYSLGVTLFHMVTGALPFQGRTAISVLSQHANHEVPRARGFSPEREVSSALADLIGYLAGREVEARYPSVEEAIRSIERVQEGGSPLPPSSRRQSEVRRAPPSSFYSRSGVLLTGPEPAKQSPPGGPTEGPSSPTLEQDPLAQDWAQVARTHLLNQTAPRLDPPDPKPSKTEAGQLLLSDDTQRAYQIKRRLGEGAQGVVYEVEVMGLREFFGFRRPIERAVIKRATDAEAIRQERLIYSVTDYRMVKLLDHGSSTSGRPYLVLERLRGTPFERYQGEHRSRVRTDPATAVELFVNLLDRLKGLHFRRKMPVVLCDVKPANIMLRMPTLSGRLSEEEYLQRLFEGRYEPVFVDLGCAQHRDVLREAKGRLRGLIGSPIFLPPESIPSCDRQGGFLPGVYGPRTDVYALALTFYQWISGRRPYQHLEPEWRSADDPLLALFELKRGQADPIEEAPLRGILGSKAQVVLDVIRAGTDPDLAKRATTNKLLEMCSRLFELEQRPRPKGPYAFDSPTNRLSLRQRLFPSLHLEHNPYRQAKRVELD